MKTTRFSLSSIKSSIVIEATPRPASSPTSPCSAHTNDVTQHNCESVCVGAEHDIGPLLLYVGKAKHSSAAEWGTSIGPTSIHKYGDVSMSTAWWG